MEEGSLNVARELFEVVLANDTCDPKKLMYVPTHDRNPFNNQGIFYTRGARIYDEVVLNRSCIWNAEKVIIREMRIRTPFLLPKLWLQGF